MGLSLEGFNGNKINATTENEMMVALPQESEKSGFVSLVCESGVELDGTRYMKELEVTEDYRLRIGIDTPLFSDIPTGAIINSGIWKTIVGTGSTVALSNGTYILNNTPTTTAGSHSLLQTYRTFPFLNPFSTYVDCRCMVQLNNNGLDIIQFGLIDCAAATDVIDGIYFEMVGTSLSAVLTINSTEVTTVNIPITVTSNKIFRPIIEISAEKIKFWIDSQISAIIDLTNVNVVNSLKLPVSCRVISGNPIVTPTNKFIISNISVSMGESLNGKPYSYIMSGMGNEIGTLPYPIATLNTSANTNHVPNTFTVPLVNTTGTLSNTATNISVLRGKVIFNSVATTTNDLLLMAFPIPVGKTLYITGIDLYETLNGASIDATTYTSHEWTVGYGATAVTMAGTTIVDVITSGTKCRRVYEIGVNIFPVSSVVGTTNRISKSFTTPLVVNSGEYLMLLVSVPIGVATASQTYRVGYSFEGFYE